MDFALHMDVHVDLRAPSVKHRFPVFSGVYHCSRLSFNVCILEVSKLLRIDGL